MPASGSPTDDRFLDSQFAQKMRRNGAATVRERYLLYVRDRSLRSRFCPRGPARAWLEWMHPYYRSLTVAAPLPQCCRACPGTARCGRPPTIRVDPNEPPCGDLSGSPWGPPSRRQPSFDTRRNRRAGERVPRRPGQSRRRAPIRRTGAAMELRAPPLSPCKSCYYAPVSQQRLPFAASVRQSDVNPPRSAGDGGGIVINSLTSMR